MGKTAATQYWLVFATRNANCSEFAMNRLEASNGNAFSLPMLFFYNLTCLVSVSGAQMLAAQTRLAWMACLGRLARAFVKLAIFVAQGFLARCAHARE